MPNLNRISGQVNGIKQMIEDGRYCPDILIQLQAVRGALKRIEGEILEEHLNACVKDAMRANNPTAQADKIAELKKLYVKSD